MREPAQFNDTYERHERAGDKRVCKKFMCGVLRGPPNFEFRGVTLLLNKPMLVGLKIKKKKILLPFVKPCYGPMLIEVKAEDGDFEVFRNVQEHNAT